MRSFFFCEKCKRVLAFGRLPLYSLRVDILTETPDWITELIAATGRFEALADEVSQWTEEFCKKDEKEVA